MIKVTATYQLQTLLSLLCNLDCSIM